MASRPHILVCEERVYRVFVVAVTQLNYFLHFFTCLFVCLILNIVFSVPQI